MVSRAILQNMHHDKNEGNMNLVVSLHGQADICKFTVLCLCGRNTNFTKEMVRDTAVRDQEEPKIQ